MLDYLERLAKMETPSWLPETQEQIFQFLSDELKAMNYHVIRFPGIESGGYIISRPTNRSRHQPIQLLVGHCDTVWEVLQHFL